MMKLKKGLLSFMSGLGFMGLGFYIVFLTFIEMEYRLNYVLLFSVITAILACAVVYFLATAFSFAPIKAKMGTTTAGFVGGILTMVAIILMILTFRLEDMKLMENITLFQSIHPIITFFLAAVCMLLYIWPEEHEEEKW